MHATLHPFAQRMFTFAATTLAALSFASAHAEAPMPRTQVPGYYRMMHGQFEVTALFDGAIQLNVKRLTHAKPEDIQKLLARKFVGSQKMQTAVNTYLINTGKNLVLVDAGGGSIYGPSLGNVLSNLRAAGYRPEQVDTVIVTHLHGDHIAGLLDAKGEPAFPNANILVDKVEHDYWSSQRNADTAPPEWQRIFVSARNTAAPYIRQGKWKTFTPGMQLAHGIKVIAAPGHTPGHTAIAVESDGARLLIWGDLVHSHAVQFARPDVGFDFDVDPKQAVATRLTVFKAVAESGELVAGMHLPFPGIGRVRAEGNGAYSWVPVEYSPISEPVRK